MDKIDLKIKSGELDLTSSGTLITTPSEIVKITIYDDGSPMDIDLKFESDSSNQSKQSIKTIHDKNAIEITFYNYNSPSGIFTKEPWRIGNSFNRELFFCYMIYGFGNSTVKKIDYSFYLGKEVTNG